MSLRYAPQILRTTEQFLRARRRLLAKRIVDRIHHWSFSCAPVSARQGRKVQPTQARAFFALVLLHAAKDVVQHTDGLHEMWSLIQHDAFCALTHRGVGDFST